METKQQQEIKLMENTWKYNVKTDNKEHDRNFDDSREREDYVNVLITKHDVKFCKTIYNDGGNSIIHFCKNCLYEPGKDIYICKKDTDTEADKFYADIDGCKCKCGDVTKHTIIFSNATIPSLQMAGEHVINSGQTATEIKNDETMEKLQTFTCPVCEQQNRPDCRNVFKYDKDIKCLALFKKFSQHFSYIIQIILQFYIPCAISNITDTTNIVEIIRLSIYGDKQWSNIFNAIILGIFIIVSIIFEYRENLIEKIWTYDDSFDKMRDTNKGCWYTKYCCCYIMSNSFKTEDPDESKLDDVTKYKFDKTRVEKYKKYLRSRWVIGFHIAVIILSVISIAVNSCVFKKSETNGWVVATVMTIKITAVLFVLKNLGNLISSKNGFATIRDRKNKLLYPSHIEPRIKLLAV